MTRIACVVRVLPFLLAAASPGWAQAPAPPAAVVDEDDAFESPASAAARLGAATAPYPASVQRAIDEGRRTCLDAGGTRFMPGPGLVRTGDLTGDGRPDYVVDFREASCAERSTIFNGTGGWDVEIFVARARGGAVRIFAGRVLDYDIEGALGQGAMRFRLHGSYCGLAGTESCYRRRRLDARPFAFRER